MAETVFVTQINLVVWKLFFSKWGENEVLECMEGVLEFLILN